MYSNLQHNTSVRIHVNLMKYGIRIVLVKVFVLNHVIVKTWKVLKYHKTNVLR